MSVTQCDFVNVQQTVQLACVASKEYGYGHSNN